jgi:hypothetical protein
MYVEKKNACKILAETAGGRTLLRRPRCGLEDNIKMDLRDVR